MTIISPSDAMVVKILVSSISASTETRKRVQRVIMILDSLRIAHQEADVSQPECERERELLRQHQKGRTTVPQLFVDEEYVGDYEDFDESVEDDRLLQFLKLASEEDIPKKKDASDMDAEKTEENGEAAEGKKDVEEEEEGKEDAEVKEDADTEAKEEGEDAEAKDQEETEVKEEEEVVEEEIVEEEEDVKEEKEEDENDEEVNEEDIEEPEEEKAEEDTEKKEEDESKE